MKALRICFAVLFSLSMSLFALNASAAIYDGGLDNVTNGPMVASVNVTVCAEQPSGEDGIIVTVLHYSPSTGWTTPGDFAWFFTSAGCYERSGVYWRERDASNS